MCCSSSGTTPASAPCRRSAARSRCRPSSVSPTTASSTRSSTPRRSARRSRAAMLTGRNHTTVGMACIAEATEGLPGLERPHPLRDRHHRRGAGRARLQHLHVRQVALRARGRDQHGLARSATGPRAAASSATTASSAARPTSTTRTSCRTSSSSTSPSDPPTSRSGWPARRATTSPRTSPTAPSR